MAKPKYDGVVDAVHYKPDGQVDWVRAYERRGKIFSDYLLIGRDEFINRIKSGKNYVAGKRIPYMASTFDVSQSVRVIKVAGEELLVIGSQPGERDYLEGIPII
jgi:hypothetical protein